MEHANLHASPLIGSQHIRSSGISSAQDNLGENTICYVENDV